MTDFPGLLGGLLVALPTGFVIGLASSLHCVGMCGPIVASLRRSALSARDADGRHLRFGPITSFFVGVAFPAGRVATYATLGILAGGFGRVVVAGVLGRALSITAGAVMIVIAAGLAGALTAPAARALGRFVAAALAATRRHFARRPMITAFAAGALNGLLPCGLVYAALAAALATGRPAAAAILMVGFGLGTTPALASVWWAADVPSANHRPWRFVSPIVMVVAGLLLIGRGMMTPAVSGTPGHTHAAVRSAGL